MTPLNFLSNPQLRPVQSPQDIADPLRQAAEKIEAGFLAEFLKSSGFGQTSPSFGGGIGEDQFASFMRQAQADAMVRSGGIGLVEPIYQSLKDRQHGA